MGTNKKMDRGIAMFRVEHINEKSFEKAKNFLLSVPSIKEIEDEVLKKATLVFDNDNIVGGISYEVFSQTGLVRYFVFKKVLSEDLIKELFYEMERSAKEEGIEQIFCVVNNENIENLFVSLGFYFVDKDYTFIDEQIFTSLEFGESNVMMKKI